MTCSTGTWTNSPTSYSYAWEVKEDIDETWVPTGTDSPNLEHAATSGADYRCTVTASNAGGSGEPSTTPVAATGT